MAPLVLDGKRPAREIETQVAARVAALTPRLGGRPPALAIILAGADPTSTRHGQLKESACRRVGMEPLLICLPERTTTAEVLAEIERLNGDSRVHGVFLQHPVPRHVDERRCFDGIAPGKDVGGDATLSFGRLVVGESGFAAATPAGIMRLLSHYGVTVAGKEAVVVGRSPMVGKPMAIMLLGGHATVTICHSRTRGLPEVVRRGEIVVAAVGKPRFVKGDWLRDGAVVIDAGYHRGGAGDVELAAAAGRCSAYTPVPGGVGPMTLAMLLEQTVAAAERSAGGA